MVTREPFFASAKFNKVLRPVQKIIIFGVLFSSIALFIYSFIFMTPFSDIYQLDGGFLFTRMKQFGIYPESFKGLVEEAYFISPITGTKIGINLAYFTSFTRNELQVFNHWLFVFGFFGTIASIIPLVYFSQKRKIYYKTNYIVLPAVATFNMYIGIHMLVQLATTQSLIGSKSINFTLLNAYETYINDTSATVVKEYFRISDSNYMFAIGYIIAIFVILFAVCSYLLTIGKFLQHKYQPKIDLSEVKIHE